MPTQGVAPQPLEVLLIEDNADDALLLERHLRRNGFLPRIMRVETEAEMIAALNDSHAIDVVLADYNLPTFSGPAGLQLLKSSGRDLPFIMMSGAVSEETAVASMRAGAHDYVTKQNLTRLVPAIERELKEASARGHRRAAELALTASESRFHRLVEAMPLGLLITDAAGNVTYANAAIERLLGYSAGQLASGTIRVASLLPQLIPLIEPAISAEPSEQICVTSDGRTMEVLVGAAVLNPETRAEDRLAAAFIADLTLQKKSEEVLRRTEKLAVAGRLAASIAHEINNPLEAITNCLYLLAQSNLEPEARSYLELSQKELNRVAQITVQTLKFYRGSTWPVFTDVNELIESVLVVLDLRMRQHQIQVVWEQRKIPEVEAYDGEIRQVVVNLISNAIDALNGGGKIIIRTSYTRDWISGREGVGITIADTGTGMDAATRSRIFEPFFSTKGITGTGLGLWVSREIVDRHKGFLRLKSRRSTPEATGGTVFRLFIPIGMGVPEAAEPIG
ncbi:response regulator [Granulicella sp. WH15]|uniref:hybrid sensor histidine kinase/response regulator n=1 Tax=Granulicella sp. WH15 TaxID=2602070 RepID=UPI0013668438|nr:hybrid sensor histidine kinase/response regulator [Granulicella sp. WH15]QHN02847.1 response regulator [Granulicella sp. WH15]